MDYTVNYKVDVSKSNEELSDKFAQLIIAGLEQKEEYFTIALSGGSTPKTVFNHLANLYSSKIDWSRIKFFWGDERCVPPTHPDSNYKMVKENLLDKISIPPENIFRIHGEGLPLEEVKRYEIILSSNVNKGNNLPRFDLVMLGLGEDGHTASIFSNRLDIFDTIKYCTVVEQPITQKKRITITGNVINNAKYVVVLATGKNKSAIIRKIIKMEEGYQNYPASFIHLYDGELIWFLDIEAAQFL
jgi:6-phosphogluconolactonase